jgi:hypothetical protein
MILIPRFRINLRPLIPQGAVDIDAKKVLKSAQREILKALRTEIQGEAFSPRAKRALKNGVGTKLGPNSITIIAKHPAFFPLVEGQKREQMTWLTKATRPIPIELDNGELIFRNATPRSMSMGSWYHPGRRGTTVIERARKAARKVLKGRLSKELQRQLRAAMRTG